MALTPPAADPTGVLLQYGAIGAFVVILGLFAWYAYKRERDRGDRLEAQLQVINDRIVDRFAEVLGVVRSTLSDTNDLLRDVSRRRRS